MSLSARLDAFFLTDGPNRFGALDGLRGWAVGMVFWVHLLAFYSKDNYLLPEGHWSIPIFRTLHSGWIGVDIFFLVSGFLIGRNVARRQIDFGPFMAQRLRRLVPALWATQLLIVLARVAQGAPPTALEIFVNFTFLDAYLPLVKALNFVTWSLGYELVFYLGMATWGSLRARLPRANGVWVASVLCVLLVASSPLAPWFGRFGIGWPDVARAPAFFFGIALATLHGSEAWNRVAPLFAKLSLVAVGGIFALRVLLAYASPLAQPGHTLFFLALGLLAMIAVGGSLIAGSPVHRLFLWRPLRWLGAMSYSVYLVHGMLALNAAALVARPFSGMAKVVVHGVAGWAITIVLAAVLWRFAERPYFTRRAQAHVVAAPDPAT